MYGQSSQHYGIDFPIKTEDGDWSARCGQVNSCLARFSSDIGSQTRQSRTAGSQMSSPQHEEKYFEQMYVSDQRVTSFDNSRYRRNTSINGNPKSAFTRRLTDIQSHGTPNYSPTMFSTPSPIPNQLLVNVPQLITTPISSPPVISNQMSASQAPLLTFQGSVPTSQFNSDPLPHGSCQMNVGQNSYQSRLHSSSVYQQPPANMCPLTSQNVQMKDSRLTVSSALFYGDHDVDPYASEDYAAVICTQDTPPSSPNSEASYCQSFYTTMVNENLASQPIYNLSSQPHPNHFNQYDNNWQSSMPNEMNIDDTLPTLQPEDINHAINVTKMEKNFYQQCKINEISQSLQRSFMTLSNSGGASLNNNGGGCSISTPMNKDLARIKSQPQQSFRRTFSNPDCSSIKSPPPSKTRPYFKSHSFDVANPDADLNLPYHQQFSAFQPSPDPSVPENDKMMDNPLEFADPYSPDSEYGEIKKDEEHMNGEKQNADFQAPKKNLKEDILKPTRAGVSKAKKPGKPRLFSFLLEKLKEGNSCIEWIDQSEGKFKFLDSKQIAHLWGLKKNKPNMQYENFARSLRTYIKKGILTKPKNKLVYQFANLPQN